MVREYEASRINDTVRDPPVFDRIDQPSSERERARARQRERVPSQRESFDPKLLGSSPPLPPLRSRARKIMGRAQAHGRQHAIEAESEF